MEELNFTMFSFIFSHFRKIINYVRIYIDSEVVKYVENKNVFRYFIEKSNVTYFWMA